MLLDFYFTVRKAGVPASVNEFLTLVEALDAGVVHGSVDDFYAKLALVSDGLHAQWERLPRVAFPLVDGQGPVFEPFAKIGLLVTRNLDAIRTAYKSAGVAEGLWETA